MAESIIKKGYSVGTISGTTSNTGNIITNISLMDKIIVAAYSSAQNDNTYCNVVKRTDNENAMFHVSKFDGTVYSNKQVTVTYYYE